MSFLGRISLVAWATVLASGACSLLAPSDESLLGGGPVGDAATVNPDRTLDTGSAANGGRDADMADRVSPGGASGNEGAGGSGGVEAGSGGAGGAGGVTEAGPDGPSEDASGPCTVAEQCGEGRFCRRGECISCTDPARPEQLEFGPAEPLTAVNKAADELTIDVHLKHPRAFDGTTKILYERNLFGGQIWLTADPMSTHGAPLPSPIDTGSTEGAPLRFDPKTLPLSAFNFFFEAQVEREGTKMYELFGATVDPVGYTPMIERLPLPFNVAPTGVHAKTTLALSDNRAVWASSDGSLLVQLMTAALDGSNVSVLELPDANDCKLNQLTWSPWLTPDGRLLFFNAIERDANCQRNGQFPGDVYVAAFDEQGHPGSAVPLRGVSTPGTVEIDASLSADQCWVYFARETPAGPATRLFRARRVR
jgi:hypothetical protein